MATDVEGSNDEAVRGTELAVTARGLYKAAHCNSEYWMEEGRTQQLPADEQQRDHRRGRLLHPSLAQMGLQQTPAAMLIGSRLVAPARPRLPNETGFPLNCSRNKVCATLRAAMITA